MICVTRLMLVAGLGLGAAGCGRGPALHVTPVANRLEADGRLHEVAILRLSSGALDRSEVAVVDDPTSSTRLMQTGDAVTLLVRSPVVPQEMRTRVLFRGSAHAIGEEFVRDDRPDALRAGLPEWMPLHSGEDREAFRRWFTALAERAAAMKQTELPREISDCSALLRYCFRESLRAHDDRWYAQFATQEMPALRSVEQWTYPNTPLGVGLFRVRQGEFSPRDLRDGTFAQFADAKTLVAESTFFLSRDLHHARPGDLIFFRLLEGSSQYHSMVITGARAEWVVYHTGPIDGGKGEMRRVLLADLLHHPDPRWRPEPSNGNFLGVYRWNILDEDR